VSRSFLDMNYCD